MSRPRLVALLLALVTLVIYLPVAHFHFLNYDDDDYVTFNPVVQNGLTLSGIKWAFTSGYACNWHPLTWISHMTDCTLFGLNPGPQHLVNVLFHVANTVLLFVLFLRSTGKLWPSAFVAALFAWHPMHVESVAWIAERKDVLSSFFGLLSLLSYTRYVQEKARRHYWFALLFFALGLLSKPMLVTWPCVMLLLDFWPLQRFSLASFRASFLIEKIPFFLLTIVSSVVTFLVQQSGHTVATLDRIPIGFRLANAVTAAGTYLMKLIWPLPEAVLYPLQLLSFPQFLLAAAVLILITVCVWRVRHHQRWWLVGWLWFLGTLVPVIGIVQVGGAAMADRYTYIPSIGIFLAVAFGVDALAFKFSLSRKVLSIGAVFLLVCYAGMMEWQLQYWRDTETLFRHTIAVTRHNDEAYLALAIALERQGRYAEALAEYEQALSLAPDYHKIHANMGRDLANLGRHAKALAEFREALRYNPGNAAWHCDAGTELIALGRYAEAMDELTEARHLRPGYARAHIALAKLYLIQRHDSEATNELHSAVEAEPDDFQTLATVAHYLAANQNAAARNGHWALSLAIKANDLSGQIQPMVWDILGMAYANTGNFSNAVACAQEAMDLAIAASLETTNDIRHHLDRYNDHKPWREAFDATNSLVQENPSNNHPPNGR